MAYQKGGSISARKGRVRAPPEGNTLVHNYSGRCTSSVEMTSSGRVVPPHADRYRPVAPAQEKNYACGGPRPTMVAGMSGLDRESSGFESGCTLPCAHPTARHGTAPPARTTARTAVTPPARCPPSLGRGRRRGAADCFRVQLQLVAPASHSSLFPCLTAPPTPCRTAPPSQALGTARHHRIATVASS